MALDFCDEALKKQKKEIVNHILDWWETSPMRGSDIKRLLDKIKTVDVQEAKK